jgi:hypothetical protein
MEPLQSFCMQIFLSRKNISNCMLMSTPIGLSHIDLITVNDGLYLFF